MPGEPKLNGDHNERAASAHVLPAIRPGNTTSTELQGVLVGFAVLIRVERPGRVVVHLPIRIVG